MALNQTMEVLAPRDEDIPISAPSGGSITVDYAQQITLLANRISALEVALSELQRPEPTEINPEPNGVQESPEPPPTETEVEVETETSETPDNPDTEKETE